MKFFPLIWRNLLRRKVRTIFTLLSVFVAFLLFGVLMTIRVAFGAGVNIAGAERLVLIDKTDVLLLLAATLAPVVPVMIARVPLEEWDQLLEMLTGGALP